MEIKVSVGEAPKPIANNVTYCKNDIATALTATCCPFLIAFIIACCSSDGVNN